MYTLPDLTGQLMKLAQENLPKFSKQNEVFEVLIQFCHNSGYQHIKGSNTNWFMCAGLCFLFLSFPAGFT